MSAGWKYHEWELKGIPLRLEIGPKDMEKKEIVIVRRDTSEKIIVKEKDIVKKIPEILELSAFLIFVYEALHTLAARLN